MGTKSWDMYDRYCYQMRFSAKGLRIMELFFAGAANPFVFASVSFNLQDNSKPLVVTS